MPQAGGYCLYSCTANYERGLLFHVRRTNVCTHSTRCKQTTSISWGGKKTVNNRASRVITVMFAQVANPEYDYVKMEN